MKTESKKPSNRKIWLSSTFFLSWERYLIVSIILFVLFLPISYNYGHFLRVDKELLYWFFSTLGQSLAAIIGLSIALVVFLYQDVINKRGNAIQSFKRDVRDFDLLCSKLSKKHSNPESFNKLKNLLKFYTIAEITSPEGRKEVEKHSVEILEFLDKQEDAKEEYLNAGYFLAEIEKSLNVLGVSSISMVVHYFLAIPILVRLTVLFLLSLIFLISSNIVIPTLSEFEFLIFPVLVSIAFFTFSSLIELIMHLKRRTEDELDEAGVDI